MLRRRRKTTVWLLWLLSSIAVVSSPFMQYSSIRHPLPVRQRKPFARNRTLVSGWPGNIQLAGLCAQHFSRQEAFPVAVHRERVTPLPAACEFLGPRGQRWASAPPSNGMNPEPPVIWKCYASTPAKRIAANVSLCYHAFHSRLSSLAWSFLLAVSHRDARRSGLCEQRRPALRRDEVESLPARSGLQERTEMNRRLIRPSPVGCAGPTGRTHAAQETRSARANQC